MLETASGTPGQNPGERVAAAVAESAYETRAARRERKSGEAG
jgi:hypothetical protein